MSIGHRTAVKAVLIKVILEVLAKELKKDNGEIRAKGPYIFQYFFKFKFVDILFILENEMHPSRAESGSENKRINSWEAMESVTL